MNVLKGNVRRNGFVAGIVVLSVSVVSACNPHKDVWVLPGDEYATDTAQNLREIVDQVREFKSINGKYPHDLEELARMPGQIVFRTKGPKSGEQIKYFLREPLFPRISDAYDVMVTRDGRTAQTITVKLVFETDGDGNLSYKYLPPIPGASVYKSETKGER